MREERHEASETLLKKVCLRPCAVWLHRVTSVCWCVPLWFNLWRVSWPGCMRYNKVLAQFSYLHAPVGDLRKLRIYCGMMHRGAIQKWLS